MSSSVRVCLVGAGRAARVHANSLVNHVPAAQLVALVDPDARAREEAGEQFGVEKRFAALEDALEAVDFEAVVITTPTFTHKQLAVTAANAGKHILLEKPMALNLAECD
ncbi:MAG: Gfo/Idh/MocA family oxidoreductase, partial [Aggregatilineaceae bacterium]